MRMNLLNMLNILIEYNDTFNSSKKIISLGYFNKLKKTKNSYISNFDYDKTIKSNSLNYNDTKILISCEKILNDKKKWKNDTEFSTNEYSFFDYDKPNLKATNKYYYQNYFDTVSSYSYTNSNSNKKKEHTDYDKEMLNNVNKNQVHKKTTHTNHNKSNFIKTDAIQMRK